MVVMAFFLVFPAAMAAAACFDFLTMTIPNRLTIGFALLFLPAAFLVGMPLAEIGMHLTAGAAMLAIAFAFFAFGWIGGGDAKFFAATALWLGWADLLPYAFWFSLIGGVLTVVLLSARRMPLPMFLVGSDWAMRLHDSRAGIPYGIALAAAGMILYPQTAWMAAFVD